MNVRHQEKSCSFLFVNMKFIIGILFLFGLWENMLGQSLFLDYRYTWTETYTCFGFPPSIETSRFTIDSNSINIAGRSFNEVLRSPTITGDNFEGTGTYVSVLDSNKVYSYDGADTKLLFDYSLQEGDTFNTQNNYDCKMIVGDIDTLLLLNGEEKRKWILYESGQDYHPEYKAGYPYWIEGIGNIYGLFGNEQFCQIDGCGSGLLCVHFENELIFNSWPSNDSCWLISATHQLNAYSIEINPNPASSEIYISNKNHQIQKVYAVDLLGSPAYMGNTSPFDITSLPPGYYFLRIEMENKQVVMRPFVKQ